MSKKVGPRGLGPTYVWPIKERCIWAMAIQTARATRFPISLSPQMCQKLEIPVKYFRQLPDTMKATVGVVLLPAPIAYFDSLRKRKLLDKQEDLNSIRSLSWKQFEELVTEAYRRKGYSVVENHKAGSSATWHTNILSKPQ